MEHILKDARDNPIARYREQANGDVLVYDNCMNLLGRATDEGTFDTCHNLVSHQKAPDLLVRAPR